MSFIAPMLADTLPGSELKDPDARWSAFHINPGEWVAEEKLDGHRLIVEVSAGRAVPTSLFDGASSTEKVVHAWSRDAIPRILPPHVVAALSEFPIGIYDGELLVPGRRSYGVTELSQAANLVYVMFDLLHLSDESVMDIQYEHRRALLAEIFSRPKFKLLHSAVQLADAWPVDSMMEVRVICERLWDADKEGIILKRRTGLYRQNKRSKDWLKGKNLRSAVFTVIGFVPSRGLKVNRGPFAMVLLRDAEGNTTAVKTRNDAECAKFMKQDLEKGMGTGKPHPAIGRKLRCDYQERTPDKSYRHIRWDRWEDE